MYLIEGDKALKEYYTCFVNLFKIIYISASTLIKHSFYHQETTLDLMKYQIIGILIDEFEA